MGFDLSEKSYQLLRTGVISVLLETKQLWATTEKKKERIYKDDAVETKMNQYLMTKMCVFYY
jgi:hypothetical protein